MTQQALTVPEIVDGFSNFLRQAVLDYRLTVIIGIDELDKLESNEKAQRFLNEVKAVFGIKGVYYLVSVSEDAMSNFERRGLPFRDAFDSAFDEVVLVDYLDFAHACRLLNERVPQLPLQFQALCFCLSGGLARELLRCCRDLIEQAAASAPVGTQLSALSRALVHLELRAKLRALAVGAERLDAEPHRSEFLVVIYRLSHQTTVDREALHRAHADLQTLWLAFDESAAREPTGPTAAGMATLQSLVLEAGSYIYFLATILETFTDGLDATTMKALPPDRFNQLARTLQAMSVSPRVAHSLLDTVRADLGLATGIFPAPSASPATWCMAPDRSPPPPRRRCRPLPSRD